MILFENHNASIRCSRGRQTHRLNMLRRRFRWNGVPFVKYTSVLLTYRRTYIWNNLWEIHMLYKFWRCHGVLGKWLVRYGEKYPVCEGLSRGVNHIMAKEFYYIKTKRVCFIFSTRQQTWLHDSHVISHVLILSEPRSINIEWLQRLLIIAVVLNVNWLQDEPELIWMEWIQIYSRFLKMISIIYTIP